MLISQDYRESPNLCTLVQNQYMKYINTIFLFLILTLAQGQNTELKLTTDVWPPFTDTNGNKSILTVLVQEALYRRDVNSSIEFEKPGITIERIDKGDFDGSPALWKSPDREEKYVYSEPYLYNQLILVGQKGSDVSISSFSELKGKRLGVVEHYAYGNFEKENEIELVKGANNQKNLEKLLSGEIDYMLVDALLIQYMLKYQLNDVTAHLALGQKPLLVKSLHMAIRKDIPNAEGIMKDFNEEIDEMIVDGTFNKILELNWVRADIDGDGKTELILGGEMAGTEAPQNIYGLMMDDTYKQKNGPNQYYVDGKMYESWDDIPKNYKLDLPKDNLPSEEDAKVKLKF